MNNPKEKIYYNPRCSKCRQAMKLLKDRGVEPEVIEYMKDTPSVDVLDSICSNLGIEPQLLIRTKENRFRELGLSVNDPLKRSEWLQILVDNPILIERPIFVSGNKVVIGRPPERVIELL